MKPRARKGIEAGALEAAPFGGLCQGEACSLIAEADHRIANHLALLAGHVRLQAADVGRRAAPLSAEDACLLLAGLDGQISAIARLHRRLSHR